MFKEVVQEANPILNCDFLFIFYNYYKKYLKKRIYLLEKSILKKISTAWWKRRWMNVTPITQIQTIFAQIMRISWVENTKLYFFFVAIVVSNLSWTTNKIQPFRKSLKSQLEMGLHQSVFVGVKYGGSKAV